MKVWSFRDLRLLLLGRLVAFVGTGIAPVALAFALLDAGGSGGTVGLVVSARFAGQLASLLVAGAVADRFSRKALMVGSDLVAGLAQGVVAALFVTGHVNITLIAGLQALNGAAASLFYPASSAAMPVLAPAEIRQRANAWLQVTTNLGLLLGGALAGVLIAVAGSGMTLAVNAATFLCSAAFVLGVRTDLRVRGAQRRESVVEGLRHGWHEVRGRRWFLIVLAQLGAVNLATAGGFNVLGPVLLHDRPDGVSTWALIVAVQSAGLLAGAFLVMRLAVRRTLFVADAALLLLPLPLALLGLGVSIPVVVASALLAGVGKSVFNTLWGTTLQTDVPGPVLSRVAAYDSLFSFASMPLGTALAGPLSDAWGVRPALLALAVVSVAASCAALTSRSVRGLSLDLTGDLVRR